MFSDLCILIHSIMDVIVGKKILKKIIRKYNIDLRFDWIVFLFKGNDQANYYTCLYYNKLIEQIEDNKRTMEELEIPVYLGDEVYSIITDDLIIQKSANYICSRLNHSILITSQEIYKIGKYLSAFIRSPHLILGVFEKLNIGMGIKALSAIGISVEDVVANGIFHLKIDSFEDSIRPLFPIYEGDDEEIQEFIMQNDMRIIG